MEVVKIFKDDEGRQLIKLPKDFEVSEQELIINRVGESIMLLPKNNPMARTVASFDMFTDDFMEDYPLD